MNDEQLFTWVGWERETEMTSDGTGDPDKYLLTILSPDGEEYATIAHRVCGGAYPLEGETAENKIARAQHLVDALNASGQE